MYVLALLLSCVYLSLFTAMYQKYVQFRAQNEGLWGGEIRPEENHKVHSQARPSLTPHY